MSNSIEALAFEIKKHPKLIFADDFEITIQNCHLRSTKFRNGAGTAQSDSQSIWIGLRLIHQKRPGTSYAFYTHKETLKDLVETAFETARRASPDPWFRFPLWKRPQNNSVVPTSGDPTTPFAPRTFFPDLRWVPDHLEENFQNWSVQTLILRKEERQELKFPVYGEAAQFMVTHHEGDRFFSLRDEVAQSGKLPEEKKVELLARLLSRSYHRQGGSFAKLSHEDNLALSPAVSSALLRRMSRWLCADEIQRGFSPVANGVFGSGLTIVDDGKMENGPCTAQYDLEGNLSQRTLLVDRGEVRAALHDTYTATKENRLSTANRIRPIETLEPYLGATNLYIASPPDSAGPAWQASSTGLYLEDLIEIEKVQGRANEFNLTGMGWRIESGKCTEPLWNIRFRVDLTRLFKSLVNTGNDLRFYGGVGSPSLLFEKIPLES